MEEGRKPNKGKEKEEDIGKIPEPFDVALRLTMRIEGQPMEVDGLGGAEQGGESERNPCPP
jgi:hypothetical protein